MRRPETTRNWKVVGLTRTNTVVVEVDGRGRLDLGVRPSTIGDWGLTRAERGILRRGLTPSGRDREVPKGD